MHRTVIAFVVITLGAGLWWAAVARPERVYTVPQVLAGLAHDPHAWAGRVAWVRGIALRIAPGCPRSQWCPTGLYKPHTARPGPILLLEAAPPNPLIARLRSIPLVNQLVPAAQQLRWHMAATYRLLFQVVPHTTCHSLPCITPLLVDGAS